MVSLDGYPKVTNGSMILIMFQVALLSFTNTPLCNCLNLRSCKIFFGFGASLLILNRKITRLISVKSKRYKIMQIHIENSYIITACESLK